MPGIAARGEGPVLVRRYGDVHPRPAAGLRPCACPRIRASGKSSRGVGNRRGGRRSTPSWRGSIRKPPRGFILRTGSGRPSRAGDRRPSPGPRPSRARAAWAARDCETRVPVPCPLAGPGDDCYRRVDARAEEMFRRGLTEEVRGLLARGYGPVPQADDGPRVPPRRRASPDGCPSFPKRARE